MSGDFAATRERLPYQGFSLGLMALVASAALVVANGATRTQIAAAAAIDGVAMGLGFTFALTLIGLIRELLGSGTLFAQASLLLGPSFRFLETTVAPNYGGFLLMILPPGGFLVLGLLLAAKRAWELRCQARPVAAGAKGTSSGASPAPTAA